MTAYDAILVGGGLANSLIAWRLQHLHPELKLLILEAGPQLGGNHTWSFYDSDLAPAARDWIAPLIASRWPAYQVRFPGFSRELPTPYNSITSDSLRQVLSACPALTIAANTAVTDITPDRVTLADGTAHRAPLVIDGRGFTPSPHLHLRWQKFLGLEVAAPGHGQRLPIIMDATVAQEDGYRFIYTLPLDDSRLLIEDTRYSDGASLDTDKIERDIMAYAAQQGWRITDIMRREQGVLPITLGGDPGAFWNEKAPGLPVTGLAAALFHPVTGYSLPDAVRLADLIAAAPQLTSAAIDRLIRCHARRQWHKQAFLRLLNRMLFLAGRSQDRHRVLARFYLMPLPLIERFYAGCLTLVDKLRLVTGKPPVPILAAIRAAFTKLDS